MNQRAIVFAIDDEPDNLQLFERTLADRYELRLFSDPRQALIAARTEEPEIVLADLRMPQLDGAQLIKELRKLCDCAAIFVTAYPEAGEVAAMIEGKEAFWVVGKPWRPEDLKTQVETAVTLGRVHRRLERLQRRPE